MFLVMAHAWGPCETMIAWSSRLAAVVFAATLVLFTKPADGLEADAYSGTRRDSHVIEATSLAEALRIFNVRHGIISTYEDPPWQSIGDLRDVSDSLYSKARLLVPGKFVPFYVLRSNAFRVGYELNGEGVTPTAALDVIGQILRAYEAAGGPGRFVAELSGDVIHVIPREIQDGNGRWIPHRSFFERTVTIDGGDINLYEFSFSVVRPMAREASFAHFGYHANALNRIPNQDPRGFAKAGAYALRDLFTLLVISNHPTLFWQLINTPGEDPSRPSLAMNVYDSADPNDGRPDARIDAMESGNYSRADDCSGVTVRNGTFDVDVFGARPLQLVAQMLMKRHGAVVTYEDPTGLSYHEDLAAVPGTTNRWQPRAHAFATQYRIESNDVSRALGEIVARYNTGDRVAEYEVRESSGQLHIVPVRIRDESGVWIPAERLLDAVVPVAGAEVSFPRFFEEVLKSECARRGFRYWSFSIVPPQIVETPRGEYSVRDLLSMLGAKTFCKLSWSLVQEPDAPDVGVSLHYVWVPGESLTP